MVVATSGWAVRGLELMNAGEDNELCRMTDASWTLVGGPPELPAGPRHPGLFATFEITQA
jgi:hypothetical protein